MPDDVEIGRPAVEGVFAAWVLTTIPGLIMAHAAVAVARAVMSSPQGLGALSSPQGLGLAPSAVSLTLYVLYVATSFAVAQALLPGPKSTGILGLLIPLAGATALAVRGLNPSAVVAALFTGVVVTPAAYYLAVRLSAPLGGFARRRPLAGLAGAAAGTAAVFEAARWLTWLADPATHGRFW